jgi:hypothetical protein
VKIRFELSQDAGGYPPATVEYLWAAAVGDRRYQIDNIPFFVSGVSCDDIVIATKETEDVLRFESLAEERGHSTVRIILYDNAGSPESLEVRSKRLRDTLRNRGCSSEQSHIQGLVAVDIPPEADFLALRSLFQKGAEDGLWDYEEATVAHTQS